MSVCCIYLNRCNNISCKVRVCDIPGLWMMVEYYVTYLRDKCHYSVVMFRKHRFVFMRSVDLYLFLLHCCVPNWKVGKASRRQRFNMLLYMIGCAFAVLRILQVGNIFGRQLSLLIHCFTVGRSNAIKWVDFYFKNSKGQKSGLRSQYTHLQTLSSVCPSLFLFYDGQRCR